MRQNMEELQATQEEMARKEKDYVSRIQELESSTSDNNEEQIAALTKGFGEKETQLKKTILDLQEKINQKPLQADDWAVAEEVEKTLKFQLDALRITQEEIQK